ncbi:amidase [Phenylobacterium aquaticum]|uniref:amidase n=1 Tax=Phenylobacterium aquaticum TaxID=1763816 RepID=UPI0026EF2795|nr:amidase [Phenylobacterium aquaticum]
MAKHPADLTAVEAVGRLRSGALSVEAFARACLERVAERDADIRAWTFLDPALVLAQARELDRAGPSGPLHGLPIGIKDVIATRDMPTQHNSPLYVGSHTHLDAACVSLLRSAGAVIFGKTDTVEFAATGRRALTRNPHDLSRTPGGSSSGSAAAVADFHVPMALGTQTGGSTVRPASFCGVPAIKPTFGLVSREGAKPYAPSLDTIGWFGRCVGDLGLLLDVFDPEPATATDFQLRGARIGLCRTPIWDRADPASQAALEAGAQALREAGAEVVDLHLPPAFAALPAQQILVMRAEGRFAFLAEHRAFPGRLEASLRDQVENLDGYSRADLVAAYDAAALGRIAFDRIAGGYDAVLTLSAVGEAPEGLKSVGDLAFNGLWTLLHTPCVNVPGFTGPQGLPIGLTVTGPRFADRQVLAAAEAFEAVFVG